MKITAIRLLQLEGELEHQGVFWEERLIRPVDIYPQYRAEGPVVLPTPTEGHYRI